MWKYYIFKIAHYSVAFVPMNIGYIGANLIDDLIHFFFPTRENGITNNMRHVLGHKTDDAVIKRTVRKVLRNVVKNYFDLIKLPRMRLDEIERRINVFGWHHVQDALEKKRGIIFVTAHLGSFDVAAQIFAIRSLKTTVIVEILKPPSLLKHITSLRESHGVVFIPGQSGALESLIRAVYRGEAILLACDRDIKGNGIPSVFFGEETKLPTLAVKIAMRTGAAVVPIFNRRDNNGNYVVQVEPVINIMTSGNDAVKKNVEQIVRAMEKQIKEYPEQWITLDSIWTKNFS